jgi:hypothetical protein
VVAQEMHNKSQLDNIVGSLWQARQESSGSSLGNQVRGYSNFGGNFKFLGKFRFGETNFWRKVPFSKLWHYFWLHIRICNT